jgi:hypothetical protein
MKDLCEIFDEIGNGEGLNECSEEGDSFIAEEDFDEVFKLDKRHRRKRGKPGKSKTNGKGMKHA